MEKKVKELDGGSIGGVAAAGIVVAFILAYLARRRMLSRQQAKLGKILEGDESAKKSKLMRTVSMKHDEAKAGAGGGWAAIKESLNPWQETNEETNWMQTIKDLAKRALDLEGENERLRQVVARLQDTGGDAGDVASPEQVSLMSSHDPGDIGTMTSP